MLELYHFAFSTCSQKVRLVLAEKGVEFVSHEVDLMSGAQHDPEYVKLNPKHVVPTLVHDGAVLVESTLINEYLDDAFPDPPMLPADPRQRHAARMWAKRLDDGVHAATAVVTFAIGPRSLLLQQPAEMREANIEAIPDPKARAARRSVIEHGVEAPEFAGAFGKLLGLLFEVDAALAAGGWLSGSAFGLADAAVLPYVLRLDHLAMAPLLAGAVRPSLADWYERARARPSFETAVTRWVPEFAVDLLRANGERVWPQVAALADAWSSGSASQSDQSSSAPKSIS
jgi:glutathione S-transferase